MAGVLAGAARVDAPEVAGAGEVGADVECDPFWDPQGVVAGAFDAPADLCGRSGHDFPFAGVAGLGVSNTGASISTVPRRSSGSNSAKVPGRRKWMRSIRGRVVSRYGVK